MVISPFQHPLGFRLAEEKKAQLYKRLEEFDLLAFGDDVYGDLPFDDQRVYGAVTYVPKGTQDAPVFMTAGPRAAPK